jgi:hypothetical protein
MKMVVWRWYGGGYGVGFRVAIEEGEDGDVLVVARVGDPGDGVRD